MTGSRTRAGAANGTSLILLFCASVLVSFAPFIGCSVVAQTEVGAGETTNAGPTPLFGKWQPGQEIEPEKPAASTEVTVDRLDSVDVDSVGTLGQANGGFNARMWQGAERALVMRRIAELSPEPVSPVMRSLKRRLLLTVAEAPEPGRQANARASGSDGNGAGALLALRLEKLLEFGELAAAQDLLNVAPRRADHPALDRQRLEVLLLSERLTETCESAQTMLRLRNDPFYQKVGVYCSLRAGQVDAALLSMALLEDTGGVDATFARLVNAIAIGGDAPDVDDGRVDALTVRMLDLAKGAPPRSIIQSDSYGLRTLAMRDDSMDIMDRIGVAEPLVRVGSWSAEYLRRLYLATALQTGRLVRRLGNTDPGDSDGRAVLYQAMTAQKVIAARLALLREGLKASQGGSHYYTVVATYLDVLDRIEPGPDYAWFAADAARALLVAGRMGLAERWMAVLSSARGAIPQADYTRMALPLWVLGRLAGIDEQLVGWDPRRLAAWETFARAQPEGERAVAIVRHLLRANGDPVEPPGEGKAATTGGGLKAARRSQTNAARGRLGLAVLDILDALGQNGPAGASPEVLASIVRSLTYLKLDRAARALGIEAALARGV